MEFSVQTITLKDTLLKCKNTLPGAKQIIAENYTYIGVQVLSLTHAVFYSSNGYMVTKVDVSIGMIENCYTKPFTFLLPYFEIPKTAGAVTTIKIDGDNIIVNMGSTVLTLKIPNDIMPEYNDFFKIDVKLSVGIDPKKLLTILKNFESEKCIILEFQNDLTPIAIKGEKDVNGLILPMRVRGVK